MDQTSQTFPADLAVIGIVIGKDLFHLVGFGRDGTIVFRRKIKRLALIDTLKKLPPCIVGMEACLSAHFVSRTLRALGHEPRIIPAIYVRPFLKGQKERLQRCRSRCGSRPAPELACGPREDPGRTGSAGLSPHPRGWSRERFLGLSSFEPAASALAGIDAEPTLHQRSSAGRTKGLGCRRTSAARALGVVGGVK